MAAYTIIENSTDAENIRRTAKGHPSDEEAPYIRPSVEPELDTQSPTNNPITQRSSFFDKRLAARGTFGSNLETHEDQELR